MQKFNWDDVSDEKTVGYEPLAEGQYTMCIEQCEEKMNKNDKEYWAFELSVKGEEKAKVWFNLYFTERTLNQCKHFFKALGLNVTGENHILPIDTIGKTFLGDLSITNYIDKNGQQRDKNELDVWTVKPIEKSTVIGENELPF